MNLKMMNESFKRKYSNTLNEAIDDSDKEQLRKALVLRSMNVVANGGNIKQLEIALQEVIENFYPDHCWWEVTDCQIFNELFMNRVNPRQICDLIVDQLKPEFASDSVEEAMMMPSGSDKEVKLATNDNGDYLIKKPGLGYTAYNRSDVCIGGFDEIKGADGKADDQAAIEKFLSGKINESFEYWAISKLTEHLTRLNEAEMSDEDKRDSDIIRGIISKTQARRNARLTPEEQAVMDKYGITRDTWSKTLSVGRRSLHPDYDGKTSKTYKSWDDWTGVRHRNGDPGKINYADRARKLPQRADDQIAGIWSSNGAINAHTRHGDSTLQDVERANRNAKMQEPINDMKRHLWDRGYEQKKIDGAQSEYDSAMNKARAKYDQEVKWASDQYRRSTVDASQRRDAAQDRIDRMLKRK